MKRQFQKDKPLSKRLKNKHTLTLVEFPVKGLDEEMYVEFRVEEMSECGEFLGYNFFTSIEAHAISYMEKAIA